MYPDQTIRLPLLNTYMQLLSNFFHCLWDWLLKRIEVPSAIWFQNIFQLYIHIRNLILLIIMYLAS